MKFVDTNILVRLLTHDVPELTERSLKLVDASKPGELFITEAVLAELCFVLEFHEAYRLPRPSIAAAFREIIATPQFNLEPISLAAFEIYAKSPKLDFADCVLLARAGSQANKLLSFDNDLLRSAKS